MLSKIILNTTGLSVLLAFSTPASAVVVGLDESVYHNILPYTDPSVGYSPVDSSISAERAYTQSVAPDDAFPNTATTFLYNGDQGTSTNVFLGADAAGDALTDTAPVYDTAVDAKGDITVSTPGFYTFNIAYADDAARVYVGGNIVAEQDFYNGGLSVGSSNSVYLSGPTSFELFFYETVNGANLDFGVSGPGSVSYTTSAVPEPSTWAMMLLGFAGLGFAAHRRTAKKNGVAFSAA